MHVLLFDTETTGLPNTGVISSDHMDKWPYIVQFSYVFYDMDANKMVKSSDSIIKIPMHVNIPSECTNIHGITKEMCNNQGVPFITVFTEFMTYFEKADWVVAHNLNFDLNMLKVEILREINHCGERLTRSAKHNYEIMNQCLYTQTEKLYCTMFNTKKLCNIRRINKLGHEYIKVPKLIELHETLFGSSPKNLHNSFNDVIVLLRCYYKLHKNDDLMNLDEEFKSYIEPLF
jgi:DNA polymerase III epsilon subunit-like protein